MDILLEAFKRDRSVSTKKLLREGLVPGCIYGKGIGTVELKIPEKYLRKVLESHARKIDLKVDGKTWLVAISEIQREAVTRKPCHISFQNLDKNQASVFEVEISLVGKPKEGMVDHLIHTIEVKGRPDQIPDRLEIDVSGLGIGDGIRVTELSGQYPFEIMPCSSEIIAKCRHIQTLDAEPDLQEAPVEQVASESKGEEAPAAAEKEEGEEEKLAS